ncbi:MAG: GAF domain-containing protein [Clostridia bacterium]|nr:GAF domain-containing protein [Clostridia bacterium]
MQYEDILKKIEQDEQNEQRTDLYRYNGLLEAIRFFANRLTLEQITDTAFDFVNELLTVDKSVMYLMDGGEYKLKKLRGMQNAPKTIAETMELSCFALYVGNVIHGRRNLETYFQPETLEQLEASVLLPLILEDKLYGFFLLSGRISASFNEGDILVCETLMNLFNNAMESCRRLEKLQVSNRELDEKIFNLFAINQSAKAMLTEHKLDELNSLAVDVFSELTQSANTGFVLYDDPSEKYVLKAYRDVFSTGFTGSIKLTLRKNAKASPDRQILDLLKPDDLDYFASLFEEGTSQLTEVKASYVVFIYGINRKVLGFVTLGQTVSGAQYKKSAFELVDSLASYTYIALTNAMLIKVVNDQKALLQTKLERLTTLNQLSKNINSAQDSQTLMELALETLTVSFGVESAFMTLYNPDAEELTISQSTDPTLQGLKIKLNDYLLPLAQGRIIFESSTEGVSTLLGDEIGGAIRNNAGVLVIPMTLERYDTVLIGALMIFKLKEGILSDEENILTFETVTNQMAPLLEGFISIEKQKNEYKRDMALAFVEELNLQLIECMKFDFDLEVVRIREKEASPYEENGVAKLLSELVEKVFPVSYNRTEVILTQDFEYNYRIIASAIDGKNTIIERLRYKKDFTDIKSFLALK